MISSFSVTKGRALPNFATLLNLIIILLYIICKAWTGWYKDVLWIVMQLQAICKHNIHVKDRIIFIEKSMFCFTTTSIFWMNAFCSELSYFSAYNQLCQKVIRIFSCYVSVTWGRRFLSLLPTQSLTLWYFWGTWWMKEAKPPMMNTEIHTTDFSTSSHILQVLRYETVTVPCRMRT